MKNERFLLLLQIRLEHFSSTVFKVSTFEFPKLQIFASQFIPLRSNLIQDGSLVLILPSTLFIWNTLLQKLYEKYLIFLSLASLVTSRVSRERRIRTKIRVRAPDKGLGSCELSCETSSSSPTTQLSPFIHSPPLYPSE